MFDKDNLNWEVSVGVTFASLMSAVSLFFTGVLISQYKSFSPSIKVPLVFLIISTFSFIFSATIYSNAGSEITLGKLKVVEKYMVYAKNIVELLGLYLFVLATPLVIGAVTQDSFLRTSTIIIALTGFGLYSQSKFSILEKELSRNKKRILSAKIVVLAIALYITQSMSEGSSLFVYSTIAVALVLTLAGSTIYFTLRSKQYKPTHFRDFKDGDAEALSRVILKNLNKVKDKDYPQAVIDSMRTSITPAAITKLSKDKDVFVAEFDNQVVGLAALDGNLISSVYTDPSLQRKGIGRMLVEHLETAAREDGHKYSEVTASTVDHAFYRRLGYSNIRELGVKGNDRMIVMRKDIRVVL